LEKDRARYRSYKLHLEAAKKVHEPLKEGEKDHDVCICRDDRCVLRVDDTDMSDFKHFCISLYCASEITLSRTTPCTLS